MAIVNKKDFIEILFTGKTQDGEIFDSNIKEDLEKTQIKTETKPLIIVLGEKMFLESIDEFLIGKEIGKEYTITLQPENAFGKRNPNLVKMIPIQAFKDQQFHPQKGMSLNIDGAIAKVISVSGGRTLVDFNNPLAGKIVEYKIKIIRKVEDLNEKAKALIEFFTRQDLKFEIKDKKLTVYVSEGFDKLLKFFKDKFKDLLELDLEVKIDKTVSLENHHNHNNLHNHQAHSH